MGNDNLRRSQVAIQPSNNIGTAVAASRQLVGALSLRNTPERVLREEYRASMGASNVYDDLSYRGEGTYSARCVTSELPMFLSSSIVEVTTPTTVGTSGKEWKFTMPLRIGDVPAALALLTPLTLYAGDDVQAMRAAGCFAERIVIRGDNTGALTLEVTFITREVTATGVTFAAVGLFNAPNDTMKNLMSCVAIDPATGDMPTTILAGTTAGAIAKTFYSFTWTWDAGIAPDYTMDALGLDYNGLHRDAPSATLELVMKWEATAVNEFAFYRALAPRLIHVACVGQNVIGAGTARHAVYIDGCYVCTDFTPLDSERDGTTLARATWTAVENNVRLSPGTVWEKKVEVTVVNDRLTLAT